MKHLFIIILLSLFWGQNVSAQEDILQIIPTTLTANGKAQKIELQMNNTASYLALQFSIFLPKGITLRTPKPFGTLPKTRFPYTEEYDEDETITTFAHSVEFNLEKSQIGNCDGKFAISSNGEDYISGNSGTILRLYVIPEEGLADGIYPIMLDTVAFAKFENNRVISVRPSRSTSYIIVGNPETKGKLDLSGFEGYMPNDICAAMNEWLADKDGVTEIEMSNVSDAGHAITPGNPNTLIYAAENSDFAAKQIESQKQNVVTGNSCSTLVLTDGFPIGISKEFSAEKAQYSRTVPSAGWYSLCLPFSAETPEGVNVERYQSFDSESNTLNFETGTVEANKPCIFQTAEQTVTFTASDCVINTTPEELTDGDMVGTYQNMNAGSLTGMYALRSDGTGFASTTENTKAQPFRAFVCVASAAKSLNANHVGATAIDSPQTSQNRELLQNAPVYTLDGRRVSDSLQGLSQGIYIINNTKVLIK